LTQALDLLMLVVKAYPEQEEAGLEDGSTEYIYAEVCKPVTRIVLNLIQNPLMQEKVVSSGACLALAKGIETINHYETSFNLYYAGVTLA
jgi:hypothetical protein